MKQLQDENNQLHASKFISGDSLRYKRILDFFILPVWSNKYGFYGISYFLGSGPIGGDNIWYHHIPGMLQFVFVRDGILSVAHYDLTWMGVVVAIVFFVDVICLFHDGMTRSCFELSIEILRS